MPRRATDSELSPDQRTSVHCPVSQALNTRLADCEYRRLSSRTVQDYRATGDRMLWWLAHTLRPDDLAVPTPDVVRQFLSYAGAPNASGRWGNPQAQRSAYARARHEHRNLRAFCRWREEWLPQDPMARVVPPNHRYDQREPLRPDEAKRLLAGTRMSANPARDETVCLLLLDTGMRASEPCQLAVRNALSPDMSCDVIGKRDKKRVVFWSDPTTKVLRKHLRTRGTADPNGALFVTRTVRPFTDANVHEVVSDAGQRGNVGRPVFPHLLRHSAALSLLRNGAGIFEVQRILGHSDLSVLRRYVLESRANLRCHRLCWYSAEGESTSLAAPTAEAAVRMALDAWRHRDPRMEQT